MFYDLVDKVFPLIVSAWDAGWYFYVKPQYFVDYLSKFIKPKE